jgi:hypothetical protein
MTNESRYLLALPSREAPTGYWIFVSHGITISSEINPILDEKGKKEGRNKS